MRKSVLGSAGVVNIYWLIQILFPMIAPVCGFLISTSMTKLKFYTVQSGCTFWLTVTFVVFGSFWTFWCLCDCAKMALLAHITFPGKHWNATFSVSTRVSVSFLQCLQLPFHPFLSSPTFLTQSDPHPHLGTHIPMSRTFFFNQRNLCFSLHRQKLIHSFQLFSLFRFIIREW